MMKKTYTRVGDIVAHKPNWSSPVTEEFSYLTSIFTAFDGSEKRDALRQTCRMEVEYVSDVLDDAARRVFYDLNRLDSNGVFVLPTPWRRTSLAADVTFGDLVFSITDDKPWWLEAGTVLVLESDTVQEAVTVASVGGTTVVLEEAMQTSFSVGAKVCLAHTVRYSDTNTLSSQTNRHRRTISRFQVVPGSTPEWPVEVDASVIHEGYPVFLPDPNWKVGFETNIAGQWNVLDNDRGRIDVSRDLDSSLFDFSMGFTKMTQADTDKLLGFFMEHMGRRGNFWIPSPYVDFTVAAAEQVYSYNLTVKGSEFYRSFLGSDTATTVMVKFPDGCMQFNRIEAMEVDGNGDTVLTLADWWEREVLPEHVGSICFLCRFMSDSIEVEWKSSEAAEMSLGFRPTPNIWIRDEIITQNMSPFPRSYNNTSSSPAVDPDQWLRVDIEAAGIPIAAFDRGEVNLSHSQYMKGSGALPTISVDTLVQFHDADDVVLDIAKSETPEADFDGGSGNPLQGEETEDTARYSFPSKRIPPHNLYADPDEYGFPRAVRFVYFRGNFIVHPIFGGVEEAEYSIAFTHPSWGFYEQEGNIGCPEN